MYCETEAIKAKQYFWQLNYIVQ